MKKNLLLILLSPLMLFSQSASFPLQKKDQFFSVQYGFPNTIKSSLESFPGFNKTGTTSIGPVGVSYEYQVNTLMSVGVHLSYSKYGANYKDAFGLNAAFSGDVNNFAIMLQSTKYFQNEKNLLIYAKGSIGLNIWNGQYKDANDNEIKKFTAPTPLGYNAVVGIKHPFSKKILGYLEAGYGKYIVAAGISLNITKQ